MTEFQEPKLPEGSRALVTGATGFTGSHLVRKLVGQGVKVRGLVRDSADVEHLKDLDIEWVRGGVDDPDAVAEATRDIEYIFHVAAVFRSFGLPDDVYRGVHVGGTEEMAKAALKIPGFKRFIHVSTIGVHSHIEDPPASEEYRFDPDDIYQRTKAEGELWFREFAQREKLPHCVVRPAAIYGPGDRRLLKFFKMALKPFLVLLGPKQTTYHLIHVEDLCRCFIQTAVDPRAEGEVFICGNAEPIGYADMGLAIARVFGKTPRLIRLPAPPFFIAANICEAVCKPLKIQPPLNRRRIAFYTKNRAFDTRKLREKLGFEYRFDNETGLEDTARWYEREGWL